VKHLGKVAIIVLSVAVLATSALATHSITGFWHGRIRFDLVHLPAEKNVAQNSARMAKFNKLQQVTLNLTIKGDHTYHLTSTGGPNPTTQISGTWAMAGNSITLQPLNGGRPSGSAYTYTLDKVGRSFAVTVNDSGVGTTISFFR